MTQSNTGAQKKGALRADQDELMFGQGFSFSGYERDPLYLNLGTKKFMDIAGVSGIDSISDGRAAVFADFDNDGDLDVFVTTIQNQGHLLFRNNVGQEKNFLRVVLEGGPKTARDAFGSVVRVKTSAGILTKIKSGGSGFISQHDPRLIFGLGSDRKAEWIEVTWPHGNVERFAGDARAGANLFLKEGSGKSRVIKTDRAKLPDPLTRSEAFARGLKIRIGGRIPDLKLKSLNGKTETLYQQLKPGRQTLINIWATWCLPCAKEMPELEKLKTRFAARGVDLIGLNVDTDAGADVQGFVSKQRVSYAIYAGGTTAIEQIYSSDEITVPLSILVDENGIVKELIPGWSAETQQSFSRLAGEQ